MQEKNQVTIPKLGLAIYLLIAIGLGIVLAIIGADTETEALVDVGLILASLGLFSGGFLLKEEDSNVRLGILIAGGLVLGLAAIAFV